MTTTDQPAQPQPGQGAQLADEVMVYFSDGWAHLREAEFQRMRIELDQYRRERDKLTAIIRGASLTIENVREHWEYHVLLREEIGTVATAMSEQGRQTNHPSDY